MQAFTPPSYLKNKHIQTVYSNWLKPKITHEFATNFLTLPDNDFIETKSYIKKSHDTLVILLHGLEGSAHSSYIQYLAKRLLEHDMDIFIPQFRSCGRHMNKLPEFYNAGETKDLAFVVNSLRNKYPKKKLYACGFSLGGSILLNYLAKNSTITKAVAISTPFDLEKTTECLPVFYDKIFTHSVKKKLQLKYNMHITLPISHNEISSIKKIADFDHKVIAPLYGFKSGKDYYRKASCKQILNNIQTPTLIIHSEDDPFIPKTSLPTMEDMSSSIQFLTTTHGGHNGFVLSGHPWNAQHWHIGQIIHFFSK